MRLIHFVLMTLAMLLVLPAAAQAPGERHVAIELVPETAVPRAGGEVQLAFVSRPQPGWHGYWKNPGDAGVETTAAWTLPAGVTAEPIAYPVPHRLLIAGLMNYVYEGPFTQFVTLKLAAGLAAGTALPVSVKLDYLVCTNEVCVPESATLQTALTVGDGAVAPDRRAQFDEWRRALPKPLGSPATYAVENGLLRIAVPFPASADAADPYFFPLTDGVLDYAAPQTVTREGDTLLIETAAKTGRPARLEGVLATGGRGFAVAAAPGVVASASGGGAADLGTLFLALGGAVLGGLLLNIMPCVFPILSLKALSLAKGGGAGARGEAVAYTAGVVLVCLALGAALLALRAGGASVGWAFQLTDPRVIFVLLLLVTAIAFNLAGLFELAAPAAANRLAGEGRGGAFGTGALAAFVATPCTGPFMGAAMGTALLLPWWGALAVFGGLGLGLALPFLLIGFVPALRRALPKPGAWMATFRHVLSIPMFATALALAWVLGRQAGVDGMTLGLAAAALLAAGLWWTGVRQGRGRGAAWVPGAVAALLALAVTTTITRAPVQATEVAGGERFSEQRLAELQASGRPVFAYFTADWCVTCKVNEKAVIETADVRAALKGGEVATLVGDWTDGDPALGRFIERHNRAGVPLYLWYKPGSATPEVLPQLLTRAMLMDRAGGS
ncbi:Thiol:disulfide interchange protein [Sphingomonas guangdongensis]|uniref:Thiol:disulfide interchange protein n=1 Tax=Sphingomonas guangdongensis TaxID=1141890 RepID=A0A285QZW4_9SPHN|nr:protein-disulfide reductase DsbD domain-containing protein [Sphingomonas guangdongensis]SOB87430.1 Thiol:disulfide interchange protein [Sphingomonas guangdongensis]